MSTICILISDDYQFNNFPGTPYSLHLRMLTIIDLDNESRQSADRTRLWFLLLQHSHILYIGLHTALTDMDIVRLLTC